MRDLFKVFILIFMTSFIFSCGSPDLGNDSVVLDGPILETVGKDGEFEFNGAVINISSEPVKSVFIVIMLKDENGDIVEVNSVSLLGEYEDSVLLPSESALFTVSFKKDPNSVLTKEVEIYYDEVDL